jgi:hypothetical protein
MWAMFGEGCAALDKMAWPVMYPRQLFGDFVGVVSMPWTNACKNKGCGNFVAQHWGSVDPLDLVA